MYNLKQLLGSFRLEPVGGKPLKLMIYSFSLNIITILAISLLLEAATLIVPTTTNSELGRCNIFYCDENFQLIQNFTSINITQNSNANLNLNLNSSSQPQQVFVCLECQHITAEQLHEQFSKAKLSNLRVISLVVKDSNLTILGNLPQGTHELKRMVISNTSIDLEVLKEGGESLDQLTTLEIANEKISNIPQNFFQEMQSLKELRLENDEIASLDGDAFHNLDDSLEVLDLRKNRFNRFPMAVKNLAQLAVLDLSDNDIVIDTQENDLPEKLEPLLNLRELAMNRINCTCEFSSSPFFEWIARTHISGVRCFAPEKLKSQEVIVFERDEFCSRSSSGYSSKLQNLNQLPLAITCQLIVILLTKRYLFI